ncbi:Ion transport protein [Paragonimus heterotremus]|uniref:Ion transport protein n=1 Tax=Paragonimus heterotremus TaxID=100268 RepID=A0A8J4TS83_9TREM|nr:Ion transport protein [Paragonimus heterotremus]
MDKTTKPVIVQKGKLSDVTETESIDSNAVSFPLPNECKYSTQTGSGDKPRTILLLQPKDTRKQSQTLTSSWQNPLSVLRSRFHSSAFLESRSTDKESGSQSPSLKRRYTINCLPPECNDEDIQFITELEKDPVKVGIGGDNTILQDVVQDVRDRSWSVANMKEQFIAFFQPSNNRLALKLFGNKVALACERRRQREQGKWVIHPCSNFR